MYDLVAAYPQLALTDSRLLGWYLRLSPEDRKLIQGRCRYSHDSSSHLALPLTRADAAVVFAILETYSDLTVDENCSKLFKTQTVKKNNNSVACCSGLWKVESSFARLVLTVATGLNLYHLNKNGGRIGNSDLSFPDLSPGNNIKRSRKM